MTPRRLLVLGASGRVGRLLSPAWRDHAGLEVIEQFRNGGAPSDLIWPDLADPDPLLDFVSRYGAPDAVLVLAGVTKGEPGALAANVKIARDAIAAAGLAGVSRVFLTSSSAVYGLDRGKAFSEEDVLDPVTPYGVSKVEMEAVDGGGAGPCVTRLRVGNVAGADTLMIAARPASADAPLKLDRYADGGGPRRSYISPLGFVRAVGSLIVAPKLPAVINFAAPRPVAMTDLLNAAGVPWVWKPSGESRTQSLVLDVSRLATLHPFTRQDSEPASMVAHLREVRCRS